MHSSDRIPRFQVYEFNMNTLISKETEPAQRLLIDRLVFNGISAP